MWNNRPKDSARSLKVITNISNSSSMWTALKNWADLFTHGVPFPVTPNVIQIKERTMCEESMAVLGDSKIGNFNCSPEFGFAAPVWRATK